MAHPYCIYNWDAITLQLRISKWHSRKRWHFSLIYALIHLFNYPKPQILYYSWPIWSYIFVWKKYTICKPRLMSEQTECFIIVPPDSSSLKEMHFKGKYNQYKPIITCKWILLVNKYYLLNKQCIVYNFLGFLFSLFSNVDSF